MSYLHRFTGVWAAALSRRSLDARIRLVSRAACAVVALLLALVVGGQLLVATRLAGLQRDAYPAARDSRELAQVLSAFRTEAGEPQQDASALLRADSLADRFHQVARGGSAPGMAAADARFAEYMMEVRRHDTVAAAESYRVLAAQLEIDTHAADLALADGLSAANALQVVVITLLVIAGVAALLALLGLGIAAHASLSNWVNGVSRIVDELVRGNLGVIIRDSGDDVAGRLGDALRRMARQQRDNAESAHALANGAYRRAARAVAANDPIGVSLARLTRTMEEIADSAQRVARGDLRAVVTPQSPEDTFGQAHAAMMRRITTTLRDVDATRLRIASELEAMRADAAALASSTAADADRLRRTVERVSSAAIQARSDAARGEQLAERAALGDEMVRQGASAMQASLGGVRDVLQRTEAVQRLARNAGILAVCAMSDAGQERRSDQAASRLEGEARALATEAADTARAVTRMMIEGTEQAYGAGVAIDRVAGAADEIASLARELGGSVQRQAAELEAMDGKVAQVQGDVARGADGARQLAARLDQLSSHVRQLDAVLKRLNRGQSPVMMATSPGARASGPALYVTPPHAAVSIPRLAMVND